MRKPKSISSVEPDYRTVWHVATPIRQSNFTALHKHHQIFNVETDLTQLKTYDRHSNHSFKGEVILSDLETRLNSPMWEFAGTSRSGVYRGKYLKGIGRTILALQWDCPHLSDKMSGYMTVSSAIREYLISCYLRAKGRLHLIVPCEGLLFRKMPSTLIAPYPSGTKAAHRRLGEIDRKFQAISIKSGGFQRHSNYVWALGQLGMGSLGPSQFIQEIAHYLQPRFGTNLELRFDDLTMEEVVDLVHRSFLRTVENFTEFFQIGINWNSTDNNYTMDGRFLDLEFSMVLGCPLIGGRVPMKRGTVSAKELVVGLELIYVFRDIRRFSQLLQLSFRQLHQLAPLTRLERSFAEGFFESLRARFSTRKPWYLEQEAVFDYLENTVLEQMELRGRSRKWLRELFVVFNQIMQDVDDSVQHPLRAVETPIRMFDQERVEIAEFWSLRDCRSSDDKEKFEEAIFYHEQLMRVQKSRTLDQLFQLIQEAEEKINRYCVGS